MKVFWLDMETTGLEIKDGHVPLEVGAVIAKDFTTVIDEYAAVIKHDPQKVYHQCIPWCKKVHTENALLYEVDSGAPIEVVEQKLISLAKTHFENGEEVVLAGNSIHFDRGYVDKWFPDFSKILHYRMLDVTALRMLFVGLKIFRNVDKGKINHRVLGDLKESIWELSRYKNFLLHSKSNLLTQGFDLPTNEFN